MVLLKVAVCLWPLFLKAPKKKMKPQSNIMHTVMFDCDTHPLGELDQSIVVGVNLYDQATYKPKKSNITSPPHGELDSSMLELLKS